MRRALVLLPAMVALVLYGRAMSHAFLWDDPLIFQMPLFASSESSWVDAFRGPLIISRDYFRPAALLTLFAEVRLAGAPSAALMHGTNIVLHALNASLVAVLVSALLARDRAPTGMPVSAAIAGAVYAAHPALVEPVAFVSGRFDLLVTFFVLAALVADATVRTPWRRAAAVAALFLLAALSKEMAATFPLVLLLWHAARARHGSLRAAFREPGRLGMYVAVLAAGLVYLVVRHAGLGYLLSGDSGPAPGGAAAHVLLVARTLGGYLLLVVWPFGTLTPLHLHEVPVPLGDPGAWTSLAAAVVLAAGGWRLARRVPSAVWLAVAGVVALLPVLNVRPLELTSGVLYSERFLTLPLALITLSAGVLLGVLLDRLGPAGAPRKAALAAILVWSVACGLTVQRTLSHWKDGIAFWTWVEGLEPESPIPATNLGNELAARGEHAAAAAAARRGLALDPDEPHLLNNLGASLLGLGEYDDAEDAFEAAIANGADDGLPHLNLADLALRKGPPGVVEERVRRALAAGLLPADAEYARELARRSRSAGTWLDVAKGRLAADPAAALECVRHAATLGADPVEVAVGESLALLELRRLDEAATVLERALEGAPEEARLHYNRGLVAQARGDVPAARRHFTRAAELAPDWDLPRVGLGELVE